MSVVVDPIAASELYCPRCEGTFESGKVCPNDGGRLVRLSGQLDPIVGRELEGRFTVLERLGQGGMGAVYRARQHSVDREVAVKVVHGSLTSDPEAIKRFLREAKLTSKLSHPNAVGVLDFGQTSDGIFYLVMELVAGITLDQAIKDEIQLTPARVVRIGTQICDALEAAHTLSIVHRDLKPSNIMLMPGGRDFVKVLDFGLAKLLDVEDEDSSARGGSVLGTPGYVPPERMTTGASDPRGDLYSLGCTLYLAATGRMPFGAPTPMAALRAQRPATPVQGVPIALGFVIDKLIACDPVQRYQTAGEAREALELAGETFSPRASSMVGIPRAATNPIEDAPAQAVARPATSPAVAVSVGSTLGTREARPSRGIALALLLAVGLIAVGVVAMARGRSESKASIDHESTQPTSVPEPVVTDVDRPAAPLAPAPPLVLSPSAVSTTPPPQHPSSVDPAQAASPKPTPKLTPKPTVKPISSDKPLPKPGKTKLPF